MWYPAANSSATHSLITMHTPPALSLTIQQTAGCTWQPEKEATQSTFWILSPRKRYTHKTQEYLASCNLLIIQIQLYLLHRTQTIDTKRLLTANSQHFVTAVITTCDETCKMPIYLLRDHLYLMYNLHLQRMQEHCILVHKLAPYFCQLAC